MSNQDGDLLIECRKLIKLYGRYQSVHRSGLGGITPDFLRLLCELGVLRQREDVYQRAGILYEVPDVTAKELHRWIKSKLAEKKTENTAVVTDSDETSLQSIDKPIATPHLGKIIRERKALTSFLKIGRKAKGIEATISWYSTHPAERVKGESWETIKAFYNQEHFVVDEKLYSIVDFEEAIGNAITRFFDGDIALSFE